MAISTVVVPLTVIASTESSGKWPDEEEAATKTRLALLLRIGKMLEEQFNLQTLIRDEMCW